MLLNSFIILKANPSNVACGILKNMETSVRKLPGKVQLNHEGLGI